MAALCVALVAAVARTYDGAGDWSFFVSVARSVGLSDALRVYELNPQSQTGPISLVLVRLTALGGWVGLTAVVSATGIVTMLTIGAIARRHGARRSTLLVGGALVAVWWSCLRWWGHVDDAVTLMAAVVAIDLVERRRHLPAAVVLGLSLAVKPWLVFLLPITFRRGEARLRDRMLGPVVSIVVGGVCWLPFLLASPHGTLASFRPAVGLTQSSILALFGVEQQDFGSPFRIAQLVLCTVVVVAALRRDRVAGVLLGAVAMRLVLDPGTFDYYTVGLVVGALLWDLGVSTAAVPWATIAMTLLVPPMWVVDDPLIAAMSRLVGCAMAITLAVGPSPTGQTWRVRWPLRRAPVTSPS